MKTLPFTKTYPDGFTLRAGEFELTPGRICCVLGTNGCGKSTLGRCLAGTVKTDGNGSPWAEKIAVGYLPQKPYPFKMSMENNILRCTGLRPSRASGSARDTITLIA